jgi:hypothetical protein
MPEGTVSTPESPKIPTEEASRETLVTDARAGISPAQMVERKLLDLLGAGQLPVSQLRTPLVRRPPK